MPHIININNADTGDRQMALTATEALEFMNRRLGRRPHRPADVDGVETGSPRSPRGNKASWDRAGLTIAKADPDVSRHLLLASGRGFVCYDLAVTAVRSRPRPGSEISKKVNFLFFSC